MRNPQFDLYIIIVTYALHKRCTHRYQVGHLFGIRHCVFGRCLMNGSNHMVEGDGRPFALCPVDVRKVVDTHDAGRLGPIDLVARERALLEWFTAHGLDMDARLARQRIATLGGVVAPVAQPLDVK